MSILKYQYCPHCKEKTYHRYQNSLRCRFTPKDCWICINCEKGKSKDRLFDYSRPQPVVSRQVV
ncbi:protein of unknown function [Pseudodesulfovibrio profundus]|uniref:Uncharacterized protein n=1 Tax=Pseudodesulfovibrio profundus TaxID=57320 RepID=A0A2C8FAA7_9BACT|nr:protein of unknown function [Pseudodesulfovibrio profundus]